MGQIQWTITLVLAGLFAIAIIGFALGFASDNSSPINIANDPELSELYITSTANLNKSGFSSNAESTYQSIINSTIPSASASGTTVTGGQFAITPVNIIDVFVNTLKVGYVKIFGAGTGFGIFLTVLLGMITFITGLLIWKTWGGRTPD